MLFDTTMAHNWTTGTSPNVSSATYSHSHTQHLSQEGAATEESSATSDECRILEFLPWSNADNVISLQNKLTLFRVFGGVVIPCVSLLGVPVNVLNCVVFFKHGLRERINLLLFCLACSDLVVSAFLFVSTIEYLYTQLQGAFRINGPLVTFITNYASVVYGSVYVSGFISTLISFERCICITHPLLARQFLKTRTMGAIVVVTSAVLITFVYFASGQKYRIMCGYYPALKLKLPVHYPNDFYLQNKRLMDVLNGVLYGVALPLFFWLTTTVTTIITAVKLKGAAAWRQNTSSVAMESKEMALTRMLVIVSCLFIVCTIPNVVLRIAPLVVHEFRLGGRHQNLLFTGILFIYVTNAVNSTFNFVFYYKMGTRFRLTLRALCVGNRGPLDTKGLPFSKTQDTTAS